MEVSNPSLVLELIEAFRRSKVMFAAVSLGVFDRLEKKPADAATIAAEFSLKEEPLARLLDACVGLKLLRRENGRYQNEPVSSDYLCRASEKSLAGYILYSDDALFRLWAHLEDAVREGTPRWQQTFQTEGAIFDFFFRTPEAKETFLKGMHGLGTLSSPKVVDAFPLDRFRRMVDLGGATGHLAIAACERFPKLHAVVFDLPEVIEVARIQISRSAASERVGVLAGNFFQDELPEADIFALGRILHDWPETKIRELLAKTYRKLVPGGALLVAEKLLNEDRSGPVPALLQSLNMLVCTEGRERTLSEYRQLFEQAGFKDVQGRVTGGTLDAIFAIKPSA